MGGGGRVGHKPGPPRQKGPAFRLRLQGPPADGDGPAQPLEIPPRPSASFLQRICAILLPFTWEHAEYTSSTGVRGGELMDTNREQNDLLMAPSGGMTAQEWRDGASSVASEND